MRVLDHREPEAVLRIFEDLCAIPHGSGNTEAISVWCAEFARQRGLETIRDPLGNVLVRRPAAPGREQEPPVILQAHLDMVCARDPDCDRDLTAQGPELAAEGDWVHARGTTLGADDGIGVAMALAAAATKALRVMARVRGVSSAPR